MSNYKYPTPQLLFKAICNAIRSKTGSSDEIPHQNIPDELDSIITEEEYNIEMQRFIDIIEGTSFINDRITTVKEVLFYNCTNLTTVNLPKCTSINNNAFRNCTSLTTVNLPKCTSIINHAFKSCTSLTTINLPECTSIGNNTFDSCTNLTTVNLPECTSIGSSAFENCTSLTTVNLPKCTSIGNYAFDSCTNLTTVNLPKCTSIGNYAFYICTNLTTIILSNNQVATLKSIRTFNNSSIANGTGYVYVPDNLVDSYKTATNWSTYANQIKPISELPSNLKEEYGYD